MARKPTGGQGSNQYQTRGTATMTPTANTAAMMAALQDDTNPALTVTGGECPIRFNGTAWTKPRCQHETCRETMLGLRTFTKTEGPEVAVAAVNVGITRRRQLDHWTLYKFDIVDAAPWITGGFTPEDARLAAQDGFTPETARPWIEALGRWGVARGFRANSIPIEEAAEWFKLGAYGDGANSARQAGFTPTSAAQFIRDAGLEDEKGAVEYVKYRDPALAARWHQSGIFFGHQRQWHEAGWAPEDAAPWQALSVPVDDAAALQAQGVTAADLTALGKPVVSTAKKVWRNQPDRVTRGSDSRVKDWTEIIKVAGRETASRWEASGTDLALAVGAARWGISPDDIESLRRRGEQTVDVEGFAVTARWTDGHATWTITGPDGADLEAERVAAAFTDQTPEWDRVLSTARRLSRAAATPGEALRWAAHQPNIESGWFRERLRHVPLIDLDDQWQAQDRWHRAAIEHCEAYEPADRHLQAAYVIKRMLPAD